MISYGGSNSSPVGALRGVFLLQRRSTPLPHGSRRLCIQRSISERRIFISITVLCYSFVRRLTTRHCSTRLLLSARPPPAVVDRYLLPARRAAANPPRANGGTDTDGRKNARQFHATRALPVIVRALYAYAWYALSRGSVTVKRTGGRCNFPGGGGVLS